MKKILLIDDEKDFCYFVKKSLESDGEYEVTACFDSAEGIRKAKELQPHLILIDIMMPGKSGPEIAAELPNDANTKNIPFVFLTAAVTKQETKRDKNLIGGQYFFAKPVNMGELKNLIDKLVE
jgi:CheY-like chemotaxis protein